MSYFYGRVNGKAPTDATRCGTKQSGMSSHISSWDKGIRTHVYYRDNKEIFEVYLTSGSNRPNSDILLTTVEFEPELNQTAISFNQIIQ